MVHTDGWRLKKLRRRQRAWLEEIVEALVDAEEKMKQQAEGYETIDETAVAKADLRGLCDERSVSIFMEWYMFGGKERGISLSELLEMPAWLRKDFRYIFGEISFSRQARKRMESLFEAPPSKKTKTRSKGVNRVANRYGRKG